MSGRTFWVVAEKPDRRKTSARSQVVPDPIFRKAVGSDERITSALPPERADFANV